MITLHCDDPLEEVVVELHQLAAAEGPVDGVFLPMLLSLVQLFSFNNEVSVSAMGNMKLL